MRCSWVSDDPLYLAYHDQEWGHAVHGDTALFERISLEAFQSGLSWLTILRKRSAFRRAFSDFTPNVVAAFDESKVAALLQEEGIVRNERKIRATIANANALVALQYSHGPDALDALIWSFATELQPRRARSQIPTQTPESVRLAKELKNLGFVFVGPTTMYALMQACGIVDDHEVGCDTWY